ncbi:MAG: response regulator [Pseudomonadota bacterium]
MTGTFLDLLRTTMLRPEYSGRYDELYDFAPLMIHSIDETGALIRVSRFWLAALGYSEDEVLGRPSTDFLSLRSQARALEELRLFRERGYSADVEYEFVKKSGEMMPVALSAIAIHGEDGAFEQSLAIMFDLTNVVTQLRQAREAERASNEAKSQFLASMSHELRTPLNIIQGYSELLHESTEDETTKQYLEIILNSNRQLSQMLEDVLDLSRIDSGQMPIDMTLFDLSQMFEEVRQEWAQPIREKGIKFFSNFDERIRQTGISDPLRIKQVLTNYLSNAVKYSESGTILLSCELVGESEQEQTLRFAVEDDGRGVDDDMQAHLFQDVQRDRGEGRGRNKGLGLSIVQRISDLLGGHVWYMPAARGGSVFYFDVPVKRESYSPLLETGQGPELAETLKAPSLRCLIVEDNDANAQLLGTILRRLGCEIVYAKDGQEGVDYAEEQEFDIIFMDIRMPKLDGLSATRVIRDGAGASKNAPIIAVTANSNRSAAVDYRSAGMLKCITKPYTSVEIEQSLEAVIH